VVLRVDASRWCVTLQFQNGNRVMLVLSRKETDKIHFPTLDITVEILRIRGNKARIGIDAPTDIPVVRHELSGLKSIEFTAEDDPKTKLSDLSRAVRSRLDGASSTLNELHRILEDDGPSVAQDLVLQVFRQLSALDREAGEAMEGAARRTARALLVEEDANQRELMGSFLRVSGFEVTATSDGQDALEYLSLHAPPDAVLLDMVMLRCNGPQFVGQIRSDIALAGLKLYAVSGTDPSTLGIATGPTGIDRWFPKPVDPELLVAVVNRELGSARAE
jgi:carbon storage regulator CsrA